MILIPAIDINDGKVVRLRQGKFDQVTEYSSSPLAVAQKWAAAKALWLHLVDLDGAQSGAMKNLEVIRTIAQAIKIPVEVGGGIRRPEDVQRLLDAGVARVILGTTAVADRSFFKNILKNTPDKIAVSLDCSNGMVAQRGWTEMTKIKGIDLAKELEQLGLQCLIYTDIARDGMLTGPNFAGLSEMLTAVKINCIASGGIASLEDVQKLAALSQKHKNLLGAITGKAIYEGKLDFKEAVKLCSPNA